MTFYNLTHTDGFIPIPSAIVDIQTLKYIVISASKVEHFNITDEVLYIASKHNRGKYNTTLTDEMKEEIEDILDTLSDHDIGLDYMILRCDNLNAVMQKISKLNHIHNHGYLRLEDLSRIRQIDGITVFSF